ncbi:hypothetical protein MUK42_27028 [Musa troglodytarum]|uniref:Uncharacterized protein n=1 Tax=Musa troglodytarum TaxID=320322 RepID=A0A9E7F4H5_9LILI|nr:hypothetical protein MUK42_27028 [Musa troglodytarum]
MEVLRRVDDVSILMDLVIGGSERVRKNIIVALLNMVKSDRDKIMGDVKEMDKAKTSMRALGR